MEEDFSSKIKTLLGKGLTSDALNILLESSKDSKDVHDTISLIIFDFKDLTNQKIRGTISNDEATLRQNKVNDRILGAIELFTSEGKVLSDGILSIKKGNSAIRILTILTIVLAALTLIFYIMKKEDFMFVTGVSGSYSFLALLIAFLIKMYKSK